MKNTLFALFLLTLALNAPAAQAIEKVAQCSFNGFSANWRYRVTSPFWVSPRIGSFLNFGYGSYLRLKFDRKTGVAGTYEEQNIALRRVDVTPLQFEPRDSDRVSRTRISVYGETIALECQVVSVSYAIIPLSTTERPFAFAGDVRQSSATGAGSTFDYEWAHGQYCIAGSLKRAARAWNAVRGPKLGQQAELAPKGLLVHDKHQVCDEQRATSDGVECVKSHIEPVDLFYRACGLN